MNFELLTLELHKHSQSWICVLGWGTKYLFYVEWNYDREVTNVQILWVFDWYLNR